MTSRVHFNTFLCKMDLAKFRTCEIKTKKNENSSKVNFTVAFCTFRDIVSLYLETPAVFISKFCFL